MKLRNIRNGSLSDQKLRSEDTVERATLDERQMQYLYQDGDDYYFTGHHRSTEFISQAKRWWSRSTTSSRR